MLLQIQKYLDNCSPKVERYILPNSISKVWRNNFWKKSVLLAQQFFTSSCFFFSQEPSDWQERFVYTRPTLLARKMCFHLWLVEYLFRFWLANFSYFLLLQCRSLRSSEFVIISMILTGHSVSGENLKFQNGIIFSNLVSDWRIFRLKLTLL